MMTRRFIMRIELTGPAKQKLNSLSDQKGMTQVATMSRLVEWFAVQSEVTQGAVLGHYPPEIAPDIAELVFKRLKAA